MNTLQTEQRVHNDNIVIEGSPSLCGNPYQAFWSTCLCFKIATQKGINHIEIFFFNVVFPFPELGGVEHSDQEKDKKREQK